MLNEGGMSNRNHDIVRLYETRQGGKGVESLARTRSEAGSSDAAHATIRSPC